MQYARFVSLFLLACLVAAPSRADSPWPRLEAGPFAVGFRTVDVTDHSRTVRATIDWRGRTLSGENFRQLRFMIWYPAVDDGERREMEYRDYIEAAGFETRMDGKLLQGSEAYLAHSTFAGADPDLLASRLDSPTICRRDAVALDGPFPAIVYAPSFSYEAFENSVMLEYLASHGYVVISSRSSGPERREMSADIAGAEAGKRDLAFALEVLHDLGTVDLRRVGAAGFSWGGLSATLLAMEHANVRAVVTLDGSLQHADLPSIDRHYAYRPRRLRGGYLAIVGEHRPAVSLADEALYTDLVEIRMPDLDHWDFASDMIRISTWGQAETDGEHRVSIERAYATIVESVGRFFDAYLVAPSDDRVELLTQDLRSVGPSPRVEILVARQALPAPPSKREFAELLREDVGRAAAILARVKRNDPEIEILDWSELQDVVLTSPFETKLAILEMARAELGESSIYFNNLGQAWRLAGEPDKALGYFRRALEHNPDSGFAKRAIEELTAN